MTTIEKKSITVATTINASIEKVWELWTNPKHITQWNAASEDWHTPRAENDVQPGGHFSYRMEAKDGSMGFDFAGRYDEVKPYEHLAYSLGDDRKVQVAFKKVGEATEVVETFDAEQTHSLDMQRTGWQSILDNFKRYAEQYSNQ